MRRLLFSAAILALLSSSVSSSTIVVRPDGSGDQPTLATAVAAAAAGDTILLESGTYSGAGNRAVTVTGKNLFILSEADDFGSCVLELGGHQGITFTDHTASASVIRGITFRNGSAAQGAGIYASVTWLEVENCRFETNSASGNGGGIYSFNSTCHVEDCLFMENYGRYGGGIYCQGSSMNVVRCDLISNTAETGAGISVNPSGSAIMTDCLFADNTAQNYAGAVYNSSSGTYLFRCTLAQNGAPGGGGGVYNYSAGYIGIDHTIIALSTSGGSYGGTSQIYNISCCDFFGNSGGDWNSPINGYFGINGNVDIDPMFCAEYNPSDPWTLDSNSPAYTASCGTMGARNVAGCGVVGTEEESWGAIKKMHAK